MRRYTQYAQRCTPYGLHESSTTSQHPEFNLRVKRCRVYTFIKLYIIIQRPIYNVIMDYKNECIAQDWQMISV